MTAVGVLCFIVMIVGLRICELLADIRNTLRLKK